MKTVLAFLLALVASSSFAAAVRLTPGPGVAGSAIGFTTAANFTGQFSAASFNSNFTANVGGKVVTMPASMRLAANAGQFAAQAVRLNPAGLVGSAVASWLLLQGLQWLDGQWKKTEQPQDGYLWSADRGITYFPTREQAASDARRLCFPSACSSSSVWIYQDNWYFTLSDPVANGYSDRLVKKVGTAQTVPATDADWAALPNPLPLPDEVAAELAPKGVPLPLEVPHIAPQDIPLSDPYVDPVTGKRYRDQARLTPSSDAKTADVQVTKQEVDEAGNPKKEEDGQTDKPPEEQTDFCKKNPDAISCMPEGQTDDQELQTKNIGSGISPISLGGQGQCMADKTLSMATMGKSITFTYKPICDLASMVRPLILALAWLLGGWIMVGAVKDN